MGYQYEIPPYWPGKLKNVCVIKEYGLNGVWVISESTVVPSGRLGRSWNHSEMSIPNWEVPYAVIITMLLAPINFPCPLSSLHCHRHCTRPQGAQPLVVVIATITTIVFVIVIAAPFIFVVVAAALFSGLLCACLLCRYAKLLHTPLPSQSFPAHAHLPQSLLSLLPLSSTPYVCSSHMFVNCAHVLNYLIRRRHHSCSQSRHVP